MHKEVNTRMFLHLTDDAQKRSSQSIPNSRHFPFNLAKILPNQVIADFGRGSIVESECEIFWMVHSWNHWAFWVIRDGVQDGDAVTRKTKTRIRLQVYVIFYIVIHVIFNVLRVNESILMGCRTIGVHLWYIIINTIASPGKPKVKHACALANFNY